MIKHSDNPDILAAPASSCSVLFAEHEYSEQLASTLSIPLPRWFEKAARKRKAEWLTGRFCAERAMRGLASAFAGEVGTRPDGSPRWPEGIVGSITHTAGFASAAVAPASRVRGIGIDSERIVSPETARAIEKMIAAPGDSSREDVQLPELVLTTLLFSAKESVFKCLYPIAKRRFYFEHVGVALDPAHHRFEAQLLSDLDETQLRAGTRFEGQYQVSDAYVHTGLMVFG